MAESSQVSNVEAVSDISGLLHDIFTGDVLPSVKWSSISAQTMQNAKSGEDYEYTGTSMKGAIDLKRPTGAIATRGSLPDHAHFDTTEWETTPVRRYRRIAMDNFTEARAKKG